MTWEGASNSTLQRDHPSCASMEGVDDASSAPFPYRVEEGVDRKRRRKSGRDAVAEMHPQLRFVNTIRKIIKKTA